MAYTAENILVGAADLYIAPVGTTSPIGGTGEEGDAGVVDDGVRVSDVLNDPADPQAPPGGWRHLGLTQGGVEFAYAPDFGEVEVDQWLDAAKMYKQRQTVTVNTTLVEATLENLLLAWGQPESSNPDDDTLYISAGALGDKPVERALTFVGQAPSTDAEPNRERVFSLDRVINVESSTFSLSRTDATTIPVSLRCLPGGGTAGSQGSEYGLIVDRTITA